MSDPVTKPRIKLKPKVERPKLHKVILVNDDFTPREFVVTVLKGVFRMTADQAYRVMMTAHQKRRLRVAVYTKDVADEGDRSDRFWAASRAIHCFSPPSRRSERGLGARFAFGNPIHLSFSRRLIISLPHVCPALG
jgi:ATP-dependent Clp protease adaptor protein ClpS